jgi:ABC-type multidrug transport system fused ATPase/permease subunit
MSIYRRVLQYYRPFLPQTLIALVLSLIGVGLNLLKPWPFKIIVDQIIPNFRGNRQFEDSFQIHFLGTSHFLRAEVVVLLLCLALVVIQFLWGITNWITNYIFVKIGLQALLRFASDPDNLQQGIHRHFRIDHHARGHVRDHGSAGLATRLALPCRRTSPPRRNLFLRASHPARINLHSGTGKRRPRAGAGGP